MSYYNSYPIPDPLTWSDTNNIYGIPLGYEIRYTHATYGPWRLRFALTKDAVTYAAGQVLSPGTTYGWVTNDVSGGSSAVLRFAGIALKAYATAEYCFVLVEGYYPTVKTNGDDDIAQGDELIMVATDGVCDSVAAATTTGSQLYIGTAAAADVDADNTVAANVKSPIW